MFGNYRTINIKQLTDCLLGKPYIAVLNPNFNRIGRVVFFGKDEKISRAVADLQFFISCILSIHFAVPVLISLQDDLPDVEVFLPEDCK